MSQLLNSTVTLGLSVNDDNHQSVEFRYKRDSDNGQLYRDITWTRSRLHRGSQSGMPQWDHCARSYGMYPWISRIGGGFEPWQVAGQTLNAAKAPVVGATVMLVDITLGIVVDKAVSDSNGSYAVGSPYGLGRSFVYANLAGTPNVAGASDDNVP